MTLGRGHAGPGLRRIFPMLALAIVVLIASSAHAQGCAQCLDSTRATPAPVQAAYRHAILLLGGSGAALFVAGAFFLRNQR